MTFIDFLVISEESPEGEPTFYLKRPERPEAASRGTRDDALHASSRSSTSWAESKPVFSNLTKGVQKVSKRRSKEVKRRSKEVVNGHLASFMDPSLDPFMTLLRVLRLF